MSGSTAMSTVSCHCPKAELLGQQHDVIHKLKKQHAEIVAEIVAQQQSLQVMSLTCSNAVYWPQVCNLTESMTSNDCFLSKAACQRQYSKCNTCSIDPFG